MRPFLLPYLLALALPSLRAETDPPNILFIFCDDHATQAISAYGSNLLETPHIDRIAREGMRFRKCYVTNSICAPSRAVVLTGKYSHLNGQRTNRDRFDGSQQTAPKLLQDAGYQTAIIGKWHLKSTPTGFDHHEVLQGQGQYYNPLLLTNGERVWHTGYTTDIITDQTLRWLREERDPDRPFLLMSQHKAPHGRWKPAIRHLELFADVELPEPPTLFDDYSNRSEAPKIHAMGIARHMGDHRLMFKYSSKFTPEQKKAFDAYYVPRNEEYRRLDLEGRERTRWHYQRYIRNYLRCVVAIDENVGRLLDYLDQSGLAEDTLVIYSSDQGFYLGEHGWFDKRWMYEESLRTPLLVRWPGTVDPGTIDDEHIVSNLDFASTWLDLAGAPIPGDLQGRSLVPLLRGESPEDWRQSFYYHYYESGGHGVPIHYGVTTGRQKLIRFRDEALGVDAWEFYDLEKDPQELRSEFDNPEYAPRIERLREELEWHRERLGIEEADGSAEG